MKMNEKKIQQTNANKDFVKFVTLNTVPKAMSVREVLGELA